MAATGFANILETVGSMGRFQIIFIALLEIPILLLASHNVLQNFTAGTLEHHCRVQVRANSTRGSNRTHQLEEAELARAFIPVDGKQRLERCLRFTEPHWHLLEPNRTLVNATGMETEPCTDGWTYDRSVFSSSIVSEWDLVCNLRSFKQMSQSVFMGGVLVGSLVFGHLADRVGRMRILYWSHLQMAVAGTCAAFSPNFSAYCFFRFLTGTCIAGIVLNASCLAMEWSSIRMRTIIGATMGYSYTVGQLILAGFAFGIRDWRWLQFTASAPFYLFFFYTFWLPESARWLALKGRTEVALKQLKRVGRINGKKKEASKLTAEILKINMEKEILSAKSSHSSADLIRTPVMRRITCCLMLVWFSTSFSYYGLVMDLQRFSVSIYLIQVIFGAVDFPAKLITAVALSCLGRRITQAVTLMLAGLTILANILVPAELQTLRTALAVFGKGCLAASFLCAYLYSAELYPTVVRQTGTGVVATMARVGGMIAPLVRMTGDYVSFLPLVIYGAAPIIAGVAALFLPETLNISLPDTIEEVETRGSKKIAQLKGKEEIAFYKTEALELKGEFKPDQ
ncbi:solute carrier family 22 member 6-A-like [Latimeria chalumnae]|uniref:solute carrier family 22 member 6-A-like n=1 Tax=Latimeria chalumnae TaxID=7897 RepID=UPI00313E61ED